MPNSEFTLKLVKDNDGLRLLSERLVTLPVFALDIETSEWWNRQRERIALIQFAYRAAGQARVVILDALADVDIKLLQSPLENAGITKVIHNASFDAVRLSKHYDFTTAPVFDTMNAARRNGERKYSLQSQAAAHLNLRLDKTARNSDWSRRPLDPRQLHYAALDAYAGLLLYENQINRGLCSDFLLKPSAGQNALPLMDSRTSAEADKTSVSPPSPPSPPNLTAGTELTDESLAVLGIVVELPNRYHPAGLAASVGSERVGLAGWIIDRRLGADAEPDEESIRLAIAVLCEKKMIGITESQRLAATASGNKMWREVKDF